MPPLNQNWLYALQGLFAGVNVVGGIVALFGLMCVLQLVAWGLARWGRWLPVQWALRVLLLVKSTPLMLISGAMFFAFWLDPSKTLSSEDTFDTAWRYFVVGMIHLAFIPTVLVFALTARWMAGRARVAWRRRQAAGTAAVSSPDTSAPR